MQEQRQAIRKSSFVGGQAMFDDAKSTLFCLVRDISAQGARLEFADVASVPDEFDLRVNGKDGVYRAKVIWRRPNDLGVTFEVLSAAPSDYTLPQAS